MQPHSHRWTVHVDHAVAGLASGKATPLGRPALYDGVAPAPDGKHILVSSVSKPYSYVTTYERFPHEVQVWDVSKPGRVAVHAIASLPLADRVPVHGEPLGPRDFFWRANDPATLLWAEALDGGDWKNTVPARDKVMMLKAPFGGKSGSVSSAQSESKPRLRMLSCTVFQYHFAASGLVVSMSEPAMS